MHQFPVNHAPAPDAGADRQINKIVQSLSSSPAVFTQTGAIDIGIESNGNLESPFYFSGERYPFAESGLDKYCGGNQMENPGVCFWDVALAPLFAISSSGAPSRMGGPMDSLFHVPVALRPPSPSAGKQAKGAHADKDEGGWFGNGSD